MTLVIMLVCAVGGYWIRPITFVKKMAVQVYLFKVYSNMLFGGEYIVNGYHTQKGQ